MLAALAGCGYDALRTRGLSERAGVSTRDLYRHYKGGIHDCFIACLEDVLSGIVGQVSQAWRDGHTPHERLALAITAFAELVAGEPAAARLALCEPFTVGPPALRKMGDAERWLQRRLGEELSSCGLRPPPGAARATLAGVVGVARSRLLGGDAAEMPGLAGELTAWAERRLATPALPEGRPPPCGVASSIRPSEVAFALAARRGAGERIRVLAATADIVGEHGFRGLSEHAICEAAQVSCRRFHEHFADEHAACSVALEMLWTVALRHALTVAGSVTADERYRLQLATVALIGCLAEDERFAALSLAERPATAGGRGLREQIRLVALAARALKASTGAGEPLTAVSAEASAAGAWAVIRHHADRRVWDGRR